MPHCRHRRRHRRSQRESNHRGTHSLVVAVREVAADTAAYLLVKQVGMKAAETVATVGETVTERSGEAYVVVTWAGKTVAAASAVAMVVAMVAVGWEAADEEVAAAGEAAASPAMGDGRAWAVEVHKVAMVEALQVVAQKGSVAQTEEVAVKAMVGMVLVVVQAAAEGVEIGAVPVTWVETAAVGKVRLVVAGWATVVREAMVVVVMVMAVTVVVERGAERGEGAMAPVVTGTEAAAASEVAAQVPAEVAKAMWKEVAAMAVETVVELQQCFPR